MDAPGKSDLQALRNAIDKIDEQILERINRRLDIAGRIGELKKKQGARVEDPARERALIDRLTSVNQGPMSDKTVRNLFAEIIAACREIQYPERLRPLDFEVESIYAVLGNPVAHSLSPIMHNRAFSHTGHRGVYVALKVEDIGGAVTGMRALGFGGASITVPHKIAIMDHLDEIEEAALQIGAVNTIVNREGRLIGVNTDVLGAVRALKKSTPLEGKTVAVIGAGGAGRAVGFGLSAEGASVTVINRSVEKGERLARDLGSAFLPLAEFTGKSVDILVNTTPVGMAPNKDQMPVRPQILSPDMVVMDIVYNPIRTRLLAEAEKIGCRTVDGVDMFVYQGARQFELWTGKPAPLAVMRDAVATALEEK